jgi:hypothetical protein
MKELIEVMQKVNKNSEHIGSILELLQKLINQIKVLEERLNNEDIRS